MTEEQHIARLEAHERFSSRSFNFYMLIQFGLISWGLLFTGSSSSAPFAAFALSATDTPARTITYIYFGSNIITLSLAIFFWLHLPLVSRGDVRYVLGLYTLSLVDVVGAFAYFYLLIQSNVPHSFSEHLSGLSAVYLTVTTFTTVGSGSLYPTSDAARMLLTAQTVVGLLLLGVGLAVLVNRIRAPRD